MVKKRSYLAIYYIMFFLLMFMPSELRSEFYKYVDKDGRTFYVDDLSRVPPEYREQVNVYKEKYDHLPAEQRATRLEKDRQQQEELELERQQQLESELQQAQEQEEERRRREAQLAREKGLETQVIIEGNRILVPVILGNNGIEVEAMLLLDTGASQTVLHRDIAQQLNIVTLQKGLSQLAGGQTIQSELGQVSYLKIGPVKMNNATVIIISYDGLPVNFSGLLGMNFLSNVQYSIDYQNQVIRWHPPNSSKPRN